MFFEHHAGSFGARIASACCFAAQVPGKKPAIKLFAT